MYLYSFDSDLKIPKIRVAYSYPKVLIFSLSIFYLFPFPVSNFEEKKKSANNFFERLYKKTSSWNLSYTTYDYRHMRIMKLSLNKRPKK